MDAFTKKHLKAWLQQSVYSGDRRKVGKIVRAYVRSHPEVIRESRSWPEIQRLAEASGRNPRDVSVLQKQRQARERAAQIRGARGTNPRPRRNEMKYVVLAVKKGGTRSEMIDRSFDTMKDARKYSKQIDRELYKRPTIIAERKNPAELLIMGANPRVEVVHSANPPAEEIVEDFTGQDAAFMDVYNEPHMPRGRYAQLGPLIALYIKPMKGGQVQRIGGEGRNFEKAWGGSAPIVVSDSTAKQIYFVAGAQDITPSLEAFGAVDRGEGIYELGAGRRIDYQCRKEHVADPDEDLWKHDHGEENGELPTVLFDSRNKRILYEGGDYRIDGPWIRN